MLAGLDVAAEAGVRNEIVVVETAEKLIVSGQRFVEDLERDSHFVGAEDSCRIEDFPQTSAVYPLQRAEPHRGHLAQ